MHQTFRPAANDDEHRKMEPHHRRCHPRSKLTKKSQTDQFPTKAVRVFGLLTQINAWVRKFLVKDDAPC